MIYGYARVSTKGQDLYGNGLEAQTEQLKKMNCKIIYKDVLSGAKRDRPELNKLLNIIKDGDYLYVCKLDRIARSLKDGIEIIDMIINKGCKLNILNIGEFSDTPTGRLTVNIMLAISEFEREIIKERTRSGIEYSKEHKPNFKLGRKTVDLEDEVIKKYISMVNGNKISIRKACKEMGISTCRYYSELRRLNA